MNQNTARIGEIIDNAKISPYQIVILTLCFLIVLIDGFDTAAIGYIAPALREEWGLLPAQLSPAFGAGLFGLLVGSLVFGPIADAIGRKRVLLVSVLVFGVGTLASAYTHSIESLTVLRFITGIGLGGAMPTCITLSSEYSPARRRMIMVTLSWSGFTAGLALGGMLAAQIIPVFGWRGVLMLGGIVPLLMLPLLAWLMPESVRFMASSPKHTEALRKVVERITGKSWMGVTILDDERPVQVKSPISHLFIEGRAVRTLLLWMAFFCSLFVFYLLTSWLPTILKDAGYDIAHASRIGAMVPLGGTVGAILMALLMLPLLAWLMPESVRFMASSPKHAKALHKVVERITGKSWVGVTILDDERPVQVKSPISHLFIEGRAVRTLLLWMAFFCSLFVFYLLTSWLPTILKDAGYDIAHASRIGAMVPLGGTVGAILMALLMDRVGPYRVLALSYLGAAVIIGATGYLIGDVYQLAAAVFLIGFAVAGAQNGLNLVSATIYPTAARVTGVSWAMANGRFGSIVGSMLGAWMIAAAGTPQVFFHWLALPALIGSATIFVLYRLSKSRRQPIVGTPATNA